MRRAGVALAIAVAWGAAALASDFPKDSELTYVSLGRVDVDPDDGGMTPTLSLDVPSGATSLVLACGGYGETALAAPYRVVDPTGKVVYDGEKPEGSEMRAEFVDDLSAMVLPTSPRMALVPGKWQVNYWISEGNTGGADCQAVLRTDAPGDTARIGIQFVFVGLGGLDTTTAAEHEPFQEFLREVEKELKPVGVTPVFGFADFEGDVQKYTILDMSDDDLTEMNALLRSANPPSKRVVTVFLVQEISNASAGGSTILGLSAGPPGTPGIPGTSKSGLVVGAIDLLVAPEDVAKILTHELGHFLGMYHTTEKRGDASDPLLDTPVCEQDNDGNGVLNSHECLAHGADAVMWWTLKKGLDRSISEEQGWLIRNSPAAD